MTSTSEGGYESQTRTYERDDSVVFLKTKERFGGLSNMAGGFPLLVNGIRIRTSEALYQACRFPHLPEIQAEIIAQKSPMTAKMKSKPHRRNSRPDWDKVRVKIMRWCLRVKLAQNWSSFSRLLRETGDLPIVEQSRRDAFWGAKPVDDRTLVGMNVLGRLLMELRELNKSEERESLLSVQPIEIPDFRLVGGPIEVVTAPGVESPARMLENAKVPVTACDSQTGGVQGSLFDLPLRQETPRDRAAASTITGLKPYPVMKDSGVPWVGEVPEHWAVRSLGRIGQLLKGKGGSKEDEVAEGVPCVRYGDLYTRHEFFITSTRAHVATERASAYTPIYRGDLLFAASGETMEDIGRSAVNLLDSAACCGGDVLLLRPSAAMDPRFLGYAADAPPARYQKASMGRGFTVVHVYGSQLKRLMLPFPPLPEQAAIVRILDHADRRIRRYIRAKQKLIKLLEEQKQAIIHRAVTRGLDPDVRLKPSGVEWLGDVPEHWEVRRLKTLCAMKSGDSITGTLINPAGEYPVYGGNGVRGFTSRYTHHGEFALIGRQGALCGNVHLARGRFWASEHAVVASLRLGHVLEWFGAILMVMNLNQYSLAAAQPGLAVDRILNLWLPVPPTAEQKHIAEHIQEETADIVVAADRAQREIILLREYRNRLIADVVTGKLDVREAAALLPDESSEPEPPVEVEDDSADDLEAVPEETEA